MLNRWIFYDVFQLCGSSVKGMETRVQSTFIYEVKPETVNAVWPDMIKVKHDLVETDVVYT